MHPAHNGMIKVRFLAEPPFFILWGRSSMVERLHGMQEAVGSSPIFSTNLEREQSCSLFAAS